MGRQAFASMAVCANREKTSRQEAAAKLTVLSVAACHISGRLGCRTLKQSELHVNFGLLSRITVKMKRMFSDLD